jgi:hypothetical protein
MFRKYTEPSTASALEEVVLKETSREASRLANQFRSIPVSEYKYKLGEILWWAKQDKAVREPIVKELVKLLPHKRAVLQGLQVVLGLQVG